MIQPLSLARIQERTGGRLHGESVLIDSVSIDSRDDQIGDLFVAIRGDHFDGHDFIESAVKRGCKAVILEKGESMDVPHLCVRDSSLALGKVAQLNREAFSGSVIGITGSSGKTTTKAILAELLSQQALTCATTGNQNNEIGVPLTLLRLNSDYQFAVIEMGARRRGDIAYLGQFVQPDIAILLNVGNAHIEVFGSYENTVSAKGEIYQSLKPEGLAVLNVDDPASRQWEKLLANRAVARISASGRAADYWAENIDCQSDGTAFDLCTPEVRHSLFIPLPGEHNVANTLAAIAAAIHLGLSLDQIEAGLRSIPCSDGRMQKVAGVEGSLLLDDTYNANPVSVKAALDVLMLHAGKRIAVLGEMAELGDESETRHREIAEYIKTLNLDGSYFVGSHSQMMADVVGGSAHAYETNALLVSALRKSLGGQETILVKGSRVARMEEIVSGLKEGGR